MFDGVPFKHAKTINLHTNFVNQVAFRPDGKVFMSVSSDKTIAFHDSETLEVIRKIEKAHTKGIMDASWVDDRTVVTCSTDNTIKYWNFEDGAEIRSLNLYGDGKEAVEHQQLGLVHTADKSVITVSLNNNINVWSDEDITGGVKTPSYSIQGHAVSFA